MADNYLERQYEAFEQRKAAMTKPGKKLKPSQRNRFYTRPVVVQSHEERQAAIAKALADAEQAQKDEPKDKEKADQ